MATLKAGVEVEIMERGNWVGPFTVSSKAGRTPDHLVLIGNSGPFEHYNDYPFNTRLYEADQHAPEWLGVGHDPSGEQY